MTKTFRIALLIVLCFAIHAAFAQTAATVSATIVSPNGVNYGAGTYNAVLVGPSGAPIQTSPTVPQPVQLQGSLSPNGSFSIPLWINSTIATPTGTLWQFNLCSAAPTSNLPLIVTAKTCFTANVPITASGDISSTLNASAAPVYVFNPVTGQSTSSPQTSSSKVTNAPAGITYISTGQVSETWVTLGGAPTITADNTNYAPGRASGAGLQGGWNVANAGATTTQSGIAYSPVLPVPPTAGLGLWVYVPSGSLANITSLSFIAQMASGHTITAGLSPSSGVYAGGTTYAANALVSFTDGTGPTQYYVSLAAGNVGHSPATSPAYWGPAQALVSGWNLIRVSTTAGGSFIGSESLQYGYLQLTTSGAANVTVATSWLETPPKATIVVSADGPYVGSFLNPSGNNCVGLPCSGVSPGGIAFVGGYPDLQKLGVPVNINIQTGQLGTGTNPNDYATWAQIATFAKSNPSNEVNLDGQGNATATMTPAQLLTEELGAVQALDAQGYPPNPYLGWFNGGVALSNSAAYLEPYFLGFQTTIASYASPLGIWPPQTPYGAGIPRVSLTNYWDTNPANSDSIHALFTSTTATSLQSTHAFLNVGVPHGVQCNICSGASTGPNLSPGIWGNFLDELSNCLNQGWCEVLTYAQLAARNGVTYQRSPTGGQYIQYVDQTGTVQKLVQP